MTEFDFHSLGELCDVKGGKRLPKGEQLTKTKTNHPYIRTRDLHNNQVSLSDLEYVPDAVFPKISRYIVNEGDIILSIVGTIGLIASIPKELDKASLTENCVKLVSIDNDILAKNFLYYYLISKLGQDEIYVRNVGSTQPKLPIYNIKDIPVPLPPIQEQKAIAEVLSSLDDKIELLQKQNETLEALAQTLFRQWFIEEADDSWEECSVGEMGIYISDYVANGSFASLKENVTLIVDKKDYALFIRNTDLKSNFKQKVYVDKHSYDFLKKTKLHGGEVIISNVGDVGSVFTCPYLACPMTLGNNVIMLNSEFNHILYSLFSSKYGQHLIHRITSGSVQQKFNKTSFKALKLSLPKHEILLKWDQKLKVFYDKIDFNRNSINTLGQTRDTLLPKLMSGQVRVKLD